MNKSTVVEIGSRGGIDPLNAMLISGASIGRIKGLR